MKFLAANRNVSYRHGRINALHVALVYEDLARLLTQRLHLRLLEVLAALQLLNLPVQFALTRRHLSCVCSQLRQRTARYKTVTNVDRSFSTVKVNINYTCETD